MLDPSCSSKELLSIPETVIFQGREVRDWYFSNGQDQIQRRQLKASAHAEILDSFVEQACDSPLVATMVWYVESVGRLPFIRHLTCDNLKSLLLGTELVELPEGFWILQAFCPPDSGSCMTTVVCDSNGAKRASCQQYNNKHKFSPIHVNSTLTVEARDAAHVQVLPRVGDRVLSIASAVAATCTIALNKHSQRKSRVQGSLQLFFRPKAGKLIMLFGFTGAISRSKVKYKKRKSSTGASTEIEGGDECSVIPSAVPTTSASKVAEQRVVFAGLPVKQLYSIFALHTEIMESEAVLLPSWQGKCTEAIHLRYSGGASTLRDLLDTHWRHVEFAFGTNLQQTESEIVPAILYCTSDQQIEAESSAFRMSTKFGVKIRTLIEPLQSDMRPLDAATQNGLSSQLANQGRNFRLNLIGTQTLSHSMQGSNKVEALGWAQAWNSATEAHSNATLNMRNSGKIFEFEEEEDVIKKEDDDEDEDDLNSVLALDILSVGGVSAKASLSGIEPARSPVLLHAQPNAQMPQAPTGPRASSAGARTKASRKHAEPAASSNTDPDTNAGTSGSNIFSRNMKIVMRPTTKTTLVQPEWTNPSYTSYTERFGTHNGTIATPHTAVGNVRKGRKGHLSARTTHAHDDGDSKDSELQEPIRSVRRPNSAGPRSPESSWGPGQVQVPSENPAPATSTQSNANEVPVKRRGPGRMTIMEGKVAGMHRPSAPLPGSVSANATNQRSTLTKANDDGDSKDSELQEPIRSVRRPNSAGPRSPESSWGPGQVQVPSENPAPATSTQSNANEVPVKRRGPGRMTIMEGKVAGMHRPSAPLPGSVSANAVNTAGVTTESAAIAAVTRKSVAAGNAKVKATPPPAQAEHLIDIISTAVTSICKFFANNLAGALSFATEHKEQIDILSNSTPVDKSGSDRVTHQQTLQTLLYILTQQKITQQIDISLNIESGPETKEKDEELSARTEIDIDDLPTSAQCCGKMLQLLLGAPNHRPAEQLTTIVLWLLSVVPVNKPKVSVTSGQQINEKKCITNIAKGFKKYLASTRRSLAAHTAAQSTRGNYVVHSDGAHSSQLSLTQALRCWNAPRLQCIEIAPSPIACTQAQQIKHITQDPHSPLPAAISRPPSPNVSALSSPMVRNASATTFSATISAAVGHDLGANVTTLTNLTHLAYKPVAGKPIAPLSQPPSQSSPRTAATASVITSISTGPAIATAGTTITTAPSAQSNNEAQNTAKNLSLYSYKRVRCHEGMMAFLSAAKWKAPVLTTIDKVPAADVPRVSLTGPEAPLLDSYEAGSEFDHVDHLRQDETKEFEAGAAGKEELDEEEEDEERDTFDMGDAGLQCPIKQTLTGPTASGSPMAKMASRAHARSIVSPSSVRATQGKALDLPPLIPQEQEAAFFQGAPSLTEQQRLTLVIALVSDVTRTLVLGIFVLARHAWAGKRVRREEVISILGEACAQALGSKLVDRLWYWLQSNCRAVASFKLANESLLEAAVLRLFAFWPSLSIQLQAIANAVDSTLPMELLKSICTTKSTCVTTLVWPGRGTVEGVLREPHTFQCNSNVI